MIRQTYGDVKASIARVCGASGMLVTDPRVLVRTNEAQMELLNEGDFAGVVDQWHFKPADEDGTLVLPSHLDRLMQIAIGGVPREIRSPWFEFVQYGPGIQEPERERNRNWCGVDVIVDRGEVCSQVQLPDPDDEDHVGPWKIRVYASVAEDAGIFLTAQGLDEDGLIIRTQLTDGSSAGDWINGEEIAITDGTSFTESEQEFSSLTVITKPVTNGYVKITGWNGTEEIELSNYEPSETTPSYRKYYSPWLQRVQTTEDLCRVVRARCRRRFFPVAQDTDPLIISNVLAVREMVIAQFKRESDNLESYAAHKATAVDILKKETRAYLGKARTPGITFSRGFPIGVTPGLR